MEGVLYASAWYRFVAQWIDGIVLNVLLALIIVAASLLGLEPVALQELVFALFVLSSLLYFTLMDASSFQGTLGKMAIGVRVVDADSGGRISLLRAFARYIVFSITVIFILPVFVIFFSSKKRMLHDMAVGSLVTDMDPTNPGKYRWSRRLAPLILLISFLFPAVIGTYLVNDVIDDFMESAEAQMGMPEGTRPMMFQGGMAGKDSHHVTYNAKGEEVSESYEMTYHSSGASQEGSWSWSFSASDGADDHEEMQQPQAGASTPNDHTATEQLFALVKGTEDDDFKAVRLIVRGADINARDDEGRTPLFCAVQQRHVEMVKVLVFKGADTRAKDNNGVSIQTLAKNDRALQRALRYGREQ
ncbi:RDD family protein [Thiomicrolovo sp. ZZH C-3]